MDFLEIQDICGFDLNKANDMAKGYIELDYPPEVIEEALSESGLADI